MKGGGVGRGWRLAGMASASADGRLTGELAGEGDGGRDEGAAVGRALYAELAVEGGEPVCQPEEPAAVGPGASDAVVAHVDRERAVLDPRRHLGASGVGVFGDVGGRFGDDEVRGC